MTLRYTYKHSYLKHVSFLPFACIQRLKHLFSPSNNNRLTWRHSMCFCTSAPLPRYLDESAHHVCRWRHHILVGRNPGVSATSASSMTCCTPVFYKNSGDLQQAAWSLQLYISQKAIRNILKVFPCCFLPVTENTFKVIVFEKLSYLWTNENTCLSLLCTKSWEFLTQVCECRTFHIQSRYEVLH